MHPSTNLARQPATGDLSARGRDNSNQPRRPERNTAGNTTDTAMSMTLGAIPLNIPRSVPAVAPRVPTDNRSGMPPEYDAASLYTNRYGDKNPYSKRPPATECPKPPLSPSPTYKTNSSTDTVHKEFHAMVAWNNKRKADERLKEQEKAAEKAAKAAKTPTPTPTDKNNQPSTSSACGHTIKQPSSTYREPKDNRKPKDNGGKAKNTPVNCT